MHSTDIDRSLDKLILKIKRGNTQTIKNYVLEPGELGYDKILHRLCVGDGVTPFSELPDPRSGADALNTKVNVKGWSPLKYLGTDENGNVVERDASTGSNTIENELLDIRNGYDGVKYQSAGDAVRAIGYELGELQEDLEDYVDATAVDGLLYEGNKLYLTYKGEIVSDPVEIVGGGGGGGSSNNATLTLANTSGWIYKTIASGSSCPFTFEWRSIENELETGPGVVKVTVNNIAKYSASVPQGINELDLAQWLSAGDNTVKITVSDTYGNSRTISVTVSSIVLALSSAFDASIPYSGEINYTYTPLGAIDKTVHFILDGKEIGTVQVTTSGRQQSYLIPALTHGSHTLKVYFDGTVGDSTVSSNIMYYDLICTEEGNNTPIIASNFSKETSEQFDNIVINYYVYTPNSMDSPIALYVNDNEYTTLTVDRTKQTWTYRADYYGNLKLSIKCGDIEKVFNLTITKSELTVEAETTGLELYLSSYGRSNSEAHPDEWISNGIRAVFENFNFSSDGWQSDEENNTVLRVTGDARLTIPLKIFETDFRTTGKTIELEFATKNIMDYDAVILSSFSNNRGLKITAQKALLKSEQSEISTQYKEDEHVRLAFVVQKRAEYRLLMVYINGILSGVVQYPDNDDFSQSNPVGITIGNNNCTIDLYNIRVYDNDLTRYQVLNNWIADTQSFALKKERWNRNNIFDAYGQIVTDLLPKNLPYMILTAPTLPQSKGDKKTVISYYVDPVSPERGFYAEGAEADVQGTSSAGYARKNYKIKYKNGFTQNGVFTEGYKLREESVPTNIFTFKADVASSEGANNVELVKLYNDISPYRTPPQGLNSGVRQGIDGYPMIIFHDNGTETKFVGKLYLPTLNSL